MCVVSTETPLFETVSNISNQNSKSPTSCKTYEIFSRMIHNASRNWTRPNHLDYNLKKKKKLPDGVWDAEKIIIPTNVTQIF